MIPDTPWHFTTWLDLVDHWQTGLVGAAAVIAATATVWAMWSQTATTVRLERERVLRAKPSHFAPCSERR